MTKKIVAIIGRPNVGKSTLFNRLPIRKKAILHDLPGVTHVRKYADAQIDPFDFTVIDTPGLEEAEDEKLEYRMMQQTMEAIIEADLLCLVVDGKEGVLPEDQFFVNFIRRYNKKSVLIVNKCEGRFDIAKEYYKLGFDNVVPISAEHGVGMGDLYDAITEELENKDGEDELTDQLTDPIRYPLYILKAKCQKCALPKKATFTCRTSMSHIPLESVQILQLTGGARCPNWAGGWPSGGAKDFSLKCQQPAAAASGVVVRHMVAKRSSCRISRPYCSSRTTNGSRGTN